MYRLLRFLVIGTWQLPEKHVHNWDVLRQGQTSYGPVTVLRCNGCGDCKIVK